MDIRLLTFLEFQNVYFYRFITLACLLSACGLGLIQLIETDRTDVRWVLAGVLVLTWRFAVEWLRLRKCAPAVLHDDELVMSGGKGHRRIPLASISSVTSRHSFFMVRRYRSWSDHLAFLELTLNTGERVHTLAESAVLEFPAGKQTLAAIRTAVLAAKTKSIASHQLNSVD